MNTVLTKTVYLMRGLPGCGKSHRVRRLAGEDGLVLETDEYFYTQVGTASTHYDYDKDLLPAARQWNLGRLRDVLAAGVSPIVIDRGNGLNSETREFAVCAVEGGYTVESAEPVFAMVAGVASVIEVQRICRRQTVRRLGQKLADSTRHADRVPASTIRSWIVKLASRRDRGADFECSECLASIRHREGWRKCCPCSECV